MLLADGDDVAGKLRPARSSILGRGGGYVVVISGVVVVVEGDMDGSAGESTIRVVLVMGWEFRGELHLVGGI
jgi:hypothetical protein